MKKEIVKIVITGPVNAGKTTLVQHLSDDQVAATDVAATDQVAQLKAMTTVGLDFGILRIDDTLELHLFGTPGQARFNFMWDILAKGAIGAVFLVDSTSEASIAEMKKMYDYYQEKVRLPLVVGATKRDLPGAMDLDVIADKLGLEDVPILGIDARKREDNKMLVLTLLENALVEAEEADATLENPSEDDLF
ncbi:MAG: GTP-binding protein [Zetaproteobacteria bacterium]|nr:MAG: GTP-binding protein [Zetaproteobacteria bacterium]